MESTHPQGLYGGIVMARRRGELSRPEAEHPRAPSGGVPPGSQGGYADWTMPSHREALQSPEPSSRTNPILRTAASPGTFPAICPLHPSDSIV